MQDVALLQGRAQGAVEAVLEVVELALPLHDVREQVAVGRGVLVEGAASCSVSLVVTSWSRRTWRGGMAGHARDDRPWSGWGRPTPTRLKITRRV